MKATLRCPKCAHNHILYVSQVADSMGGGNCGGVDPWKLVMVRNSPSSSYARTYGYKEEASSVIKLSLAAKPRQP